MIELVFFYIFLTDKGVWYKHQETVNICFILPYALYIFNKIENNCIQLMIINNEKWIILIFFLSVATKTCTIAIYILCHWKQHVINNDQFSTGNK
jgi:hypothetical protein